jgi:hypothetical protein
VKAERHGKGLAAEIEAGRSIPYLGASGHESRKIVCGSAQSRLRSGGMRPRRGVPVHRCSCIVGRASLFGDRWSCIVGRASLFVLRCSLVVLLLSLRVSEGGLMENCYDHP